MHNTILHAPATIHLGTLRKENGLCIRSHNHADSEHSLVREIRGRN